MKNLNTRALLFWLSGLFFAVNALSQDIDLSGKWEATIKVTRAFWENGPTKLHYKVSLARKDSVTFIGKAETKTKVRLWNGMGESMVKGPSSCVTDIIFTVRKDSMIDFRETGKMVESGPDKFSHKIGELIYQPGKKNRTLEGEYWEVGDITKTKITLRRVK